MAGGVVGAAYTDTGVAAGQTYFYVVTAVDANGAESVYSNQASALVPTPQRLARVPIARIVARIW